MGFVVVFDPDPPTQITRSANNAFLAVTLRSAVNESVSRTAFLVMRHDAATAGLFSACVQELPAGLLGLVGSDLDGEVAHDYRAYVRNEVVPSMRKTADILLTHASVIEMPDLGWLASKFKDENWQMDSSKVFVDNFLGHALAWESVLDCWDQNRLSVLTPQGHALPYKGLQEVLRWSLQKGERSCRRDCHSAAPPSTLIMCFNRGGERASAK